MAQSLAKLHLHIVFSTKNRQALIGDAVRTRLHGYLAEVVAVTGSHALVINSMDDHVHILCDLHRTVAVSDLIELIKIRSSRWMKEQGRPGFAWQSGFAAFAVSAGDVPMITTYIERQRDHHRQQSFQDELRDFLRRNHVEWDERYVWADE
jgi:REP element-mobilizing transposase RayT